MKFKRMPIEVESPEERGYATITCNLAESSVRDIPLSNLNIDLSEVILMYGEHRGKRRLRELIAGNTTMHPDEVLVTPSAATALFIIHTTLLNPGDNLVVIRPNYATNLETPRAIGCETSVVDLHFEDGYELSAEKIISCLQPNTKLISITTPHNPTGKLLSAKQINALITLAEQKGIYLLVDETYRELNFLTDLPPYYAEHSEKVISVSSLSKAYGAPGIRTGWLINKNAALMNDFLAAKEQIIICNSVVDEEIAIQVLLQKNRLLTETHRHIRSNFEILKSWMKTQNFMEWVEPEAGVVCFPRITSIAEEEANRFHEILNQKYSTVVGPGHWFEQEKKYMRIGFGYPDTDELKAGLQHLQSAFAEL